MKYPMLFAALFAATQIFAQQTIVMDETLPAALHYTYLNVQGPSAGPIRELMRELAPQDPKRVEFDLLYDRRCRILANAYNRIEVLVDFTRIRTTGNTQFMGFDCSSTLIPEGLTVVVELLRNGQPVLTRTVPNQTVSEDGTVQTIRLEYGDTVATRNYTVRFATTDFLYGNNNLARLRRRIEAIRQYETAAADLQRMGAALVSINLDNPHPDQLPTLAAQLSELDRNYMGMGNAPFWDELQLRRPNAFDPRNLNLTGGRFGEELRLRQQRLTALQATVHEMYYADALRFFEKKDYAAAQRSLEKSFNANNRFGPAHYLAASIFYEEKQYGRSEERLGFLLNELQPTVELRRQAFSLADALVQVRLNEAERLTAEKKFREAEEACLASRSFAQRLSGYAPDLTALDRALAQVREADFSDRLAAAQQAYQDKRFDQAIAAIEPLKSLQQQYRLRPDVDVEQFRRTVLQEKLRVLVARTDADLTAGRIADARKGLAEAEALVRAHPSVLDGQVTVVPLRSTVMVTQAKLYHQELTDKFNAAQQFFLDKRFEQSLEAVQNSMARLDQIQADFADQWRYAPDFVQTPERIRSQLSQLKYNTLYAMGTRDLKAKNLPSALTNAREALAFAQGARLSADLPNAERLIEDIQLENYLRLVAEGEAAETQNRHPEALLHFRQAAALDSEYGFSAKGRAKGIGGRVYSAASNQLIQKVDRLLSENPDNARLRRELPLLQDEAARENVSREPGVTAAFRRIEERVCQNALGLHTQALDRCERLAGALDYLGAQKEMLNAENVLREYPTCTIAPDRLNALRDRVNACARYQQTIADAEAKIRLFDHNRAIALFEEAAQLYQNPLVGSNLREHPSGKLYTYLLGEKNGALQLAGAHRFAEKEAVDEAYQLLKQALLNRADVRQTALLQSKLGRAFAEKTFSRTVKSKDALASVCPPELAKALKGFQKAFSARWKELQRLP
jgi:hypothetical protein